MPSNVPGLASRYMEQLYLFEPEPPKTDDGKYFSPTGDIIAVDFETFYSEDVSVTELGVYHYVNHPLWDAYFVAISDGNTSWVGHPKNFAWRSINGKTWLSHNAEFDGMVFVRLRELGVIPEDVRPAAWFCTANMSAYLGSQRSLKAACEFLLGIKVDKNVRDRAKGKCWRDIVRAGLGDEFVAYARADAVNCHRLWTKHSHLWPESERRLTQMTLLQGLRGFHVDHQYLCEALPILKHQIWTAQQGLPSKLMADVDAGKTGISNKSLAIACREAGIEPPVAAETNKISTAEDNEEFDAWVEKYRPTHPWVGALAELRKLNILLGRLEKMVLRKRPDGCMSFELKYFNAGTGRWAGGGGYSVHNLLKSDTAPLKSPFVVGDTGEVVLSTAKVVPGDTLGLPGAGLFRVVEVSPQDKVCRVRVERTLRGHLEDGAVLQPGSRAVIGGSGIDLRGMILPRPGSQFVICDLAQIEPRILAWLVGDTELLKLIEGGMSIYEAHARVTMGWNKGELKREDKRLYQLAKIRVLGLGYGCGSKKFTNIAKLWTGGEIMLSPAEAKKQVKDFRSSNPGIVQLWKTLDLDMKRSLGDTYRIELPNGRGLEYTDIHVEAGQYYGVGLNRGVRQRKKLYGGLLVENCVQAIARDVFAEGMLRLLDRGIEIVFSVHDEVLCEVPLGTPATMIADAMTITPRWLAGCPLAAEAVIAERYGK